MDWTNFFKLNVIRTGPTGNRPYFYSTLSVPKEIPMQDLLITNFDAWEMSESERSRLSLSLRRILHCHSYFNSLEFERISSNFIQRLINEKEDELYFHTQGGGIYLFLAALKGQNFLLQKKRIICQTSEIPIPIIKLPIENKLNLQFTYRPNSMSYLAGFPSLWARTEILQLFDRKTLQSKVA